MQKIEINLNKSRDEILKDIEEIEKYFSSLSIEIEKDNTGRFEDIKPLMNACCKGSLFLVKCAIRKSKEKDRIDKHIDFLKRSYAMFVKYYEKAEKEQGIE